MPTTHKNRVTRDEATEMVRLYEQGLTAPEIGKQLGRGSTSVYRVLVAAGFKPKTFDRQRLRARALTDEQEQELVRLNRGGMTIVGLMECFGITSVTVRNALKRQGEAPYTHRGRWIQQDEAARKDMAERWTEGEAITNIATSYGISAYTVRRILRRNGIQLPDQAPQRRPSPGQPAEGYVNSDGYRLLWVPEDDPFACMRYASGYIREHRYVMAQKLGRPLGSHEQVHHINGDKADNRPENLQLRQGVHGKGVILQCLDCGSANVGHVPIADSVTGT